MSSRHHNHNRLAARLGAHLTDRDRIGLRLIPPQTLPRLALALLIGSSLVQPVEAKKRKPVRREEAPELVTYGQREDVMRLGAEIAERRGLDRAWVQGALAQSRFVPAVVKYIMPPPAGTAKNWALYRSRFVEPKRLRAGLAFWADNERWLQRAQELYGVPPELIVGVVGVESLYGQQMGGFRVIDALATLSFDFPTGRKDRSTFFRDELEQFFVLCDREKLDPLSPKGSYAGAMGMGQFMPSSWNKYAVDFDGDGHIDLHASGADVVGSIAHYFAQYGWQRGMPTRFDVGAPVEVADRAALLVPDIVPSFTPEEFLRRGASLPAAAREFNGRLALIELQNGDAAPSYVAGTPNFYAVTRYNWSSYYAMAVLDLGETIAQLRPRSAAASVEATAASGSSGASSGVSSGASPGASAAGAVAAPEATPASPSAPAAQ